MSLQIYPTVLGRDKSDQELHIWDPDCDLKSKYEHTNEMNCECKWGAGLLDDKAALILYLFHEKETIEINFEQEIHVGPERKMNSWDVLFSMQPTSLVVAYGDSPKNKDHWLRVYFNHEGDLMNSLRHFIQQTLDLVDDQGEDMTPDPVIEQIVDYVRKEQT